MRLFSLPGIFAVLTLAFACSEEKAPNNPEPAATSTSTEAPSSESQQEPQKTTCTPKSVETESCPVDNGTAIRMRICQKSGVWAPFEPCRYTCSAGFHLEKDQCVPDSAEDLTTQTLFVYSRAQGTLAASCTEHTLHGRVSVVEDQLAQLRGYAQNSRDQKIVENCSTYKMEVSCKTQAKSNFDSTITTFWSEADKAKAESICTKLKGTLSHK